VVAGRVVAHVEQHVPQRERVLAAADADEEAVVLREHLVIVDGLGDLVADVTQEAVGAESGVRARDLDLGRRTAAAAFGRDPGRPAAGSARDHRADLDLIGIGEPLLARQQISVPDDEHRLGIDVQPLEQRAHARRAGDLDLAGWVAELDLHRFQR
jgi:hypothetical protein